MFFLSDLFFGKKTRNSLEEHGVDPIYMGQARHGSNGR